MLNIYSQAKQSVNYVGVSLSHSHSPPSLSRALPLRVSRSLPGSCIFNPLSSSLSQGTRHVEQQLRFFFSSSFFGGSDCFMTHLPQLVAIDCVARVAPQGLPRVPPHTEKRKPHLPHARFSTCDLTFPFPASFHIPNPKTNSKRNRKSNSIPKIVSL